MISALCANVLETPAGKRSAAMLNVVMMIEQNVNASVELGRKVLIHREQTSL